MEIKFKRDTQFRKQFFVPDSFAHPAKMDAQLLIWIVERYTKEGEVILDPMAGSGTAMLACTLGRNVVLVELEEKFCQMMRDNWELVKIQPQLGSAMGGCQIIKGDARQLEGLLVDKIVTSPPYAEVGTDIPVTGRHHQVIRKDSTHTLGYIDNCILSPPYAEAQSGGGIAQEGYTKDYQKDKIGGQNIDPVGKRSYMPENIGKTKGQIGNLPYGNIDSIITSPPYEGTTGEGKEIGSEGHAVGAFHYGDDSRQIGNLKSQSYLEAMLQVYRQCHKVLKLEGLLILVTKNFIRNKQIVRLDTDTIKLCEQAGFNFLERHYRKLPGQSFWRVIYHQKHPEVEQINHEDILVFRK